jgi:hypothetical protein
MREHAALGPDEVVEDTHIPAHFGLIEFFRRLRTDQLSILVPEVFKRNITYNRLLFLHSFMVIKPEYIERVLLTNQKNYGKSHFLTIAGA